MIQEADAPNELRFEILPQPDDTTCGPTCLHAVYRHLGEELELEEVIASTGRLESGGTLGVLLGQHALERGYAATLYSYNLRVFDPTWFQDGAGGGGDGGAGDGRVTGDLAERLREQLRYKKGVRLQATMRAYLEFVELGGEIRFEDLNENLIARYLDSSVPILTGLSATYLYRSPREFGPDDEPDDVRGEPVGHFVVLCGRDGDAHTVTVADPLHPNPVSSTQYYHVGVDRLLGAIMLGTLTYDGNLLVIEPAKAE